MFWLKDEQGNLVNLEGCSQVKLMRLPKESLIAPSKAAVAVVAHISLGGAGSLPDGSAAVVDQGVVLFSVGSLDGDTSTALRMCQSYLDGLEAMLVRMGAGVASSVLSQPAMRMAYVDRE